MHYLLLFIIYLAFISLGLPDSLLGSAWPIMHQDIHTSISNSGIIFMLISLGTTVASLNADRLITSFGAAKITAFSTLLTVITLLGFSYSHSLFELCLWAIPYGLGAGAIDTALNHYVALHYKSSHMNWLHCMWGIGATIGPLIMGFSLSQNNNWKLGYRYVALLQFLLTILLFLTLSLWKQHKQTTQENINHYSLFNILKISGTKEMMLTFFCYCAIEQSTALWASSWLVHAKEITPTIAAHYAALFLTGITIGRAIGGLISNKFTDTQMIRIGLLFFTIGILCLIQNFSTHLSLLGLVISGVGGAPIFPSLIHSIPAQFGEENAQSIIGTQMASAYIGTSLMPPLFGYLLNYFSIDIFPIFLCILLCIMIFMHERLVRKP